MGSKAYRFEVSPALGFAGGLPVIYIALDLCLDEYNLCMNGYHFGRVSLLTFRLYLVYICAIRCGIETDADVQYHIIEDI